MIFPFHIFNTPAYKLWENLSLCWKTWSFAPYLFIKSAYILSWFINNTTRRKTSSQDFLEDEIDQEGWDLVCHPKICATYELSFIKVSPRE